MINPAALADVDLFALFAATENMVDAPPNAEETAREMRAAAPCPRCCGYGRLTQYHHVRGGVCFDCGGDGIDRGPAGSTGDRD